MFDPYLTDPQSRERRAALPLRRRGVLLGLSAMLMRRIVNTLGPMFPAFTGGRALANTLNSGQVDQPRIPELIRSQQRRNKVRRALRAGFGVQYWGQTFSANQLAAAPHGLLIIETAKVGASIVGNSQEVFFSPDEIRQIGHHGRRPVLGYLNLAKIEPYRNYWVNALAASGARETLGPGDAAWIGPTLGPDGTLARFWTPEWAAILADRVDCLMRQGLDGLFLDDVLQYYASYAAIVQARPAFAVTGGPVSSADFARAMMKLVVAVASRVRLHDFGALVIINSGIYVGRDAGEDPENAPLSDTFAQYRSAIDGILIESIFASGGDDAAISVLHEEFASQGVPVLTVDFADAANMAPAEMKAKIRQRALSEGFAPYIADDAAFNRLFAPIPATPADLAGP